jgi:hypothetical protein
MGTWGCPEDTGLLCSLLEVFLQCGFCSTCHCALLCDPTQSGDSLPQSQDHSICCIMGEGGGGPGSTSKPGLIEGFLGPVLGLEEQGDLTGLLLPRSRKQIGHPDTVTRLLSLVLPEWPTKL